MDNLLLKKEMTSEQLSMVDAEVERRRKSKLIMYVLWWFTGVFGGHRYYLKDFGYAIGMTCTLGGLGVWTLIDVFLIGKRLEIKTAELEREVITKVKAINN